METSPSRERLFRWLLALGCFTLVLVCFSPAWSAFSLWSRVPEMGFQIEVRRGVSVLEQVAHPGNALTDPLHRAIQWRLLFPLIGHLLPLPPAAFFALAHLGCLLVIAYLITLFRRARFTWADTAFTAVTLGAASWFFTSTGWLGYFDSWLALALLAVAFAPTRWPVSTACLLAPWIDERFVIAAPLAFYCRSVFQPTKPPALLVPAALLVVFLIIRLSVLPHYSAAGATVAGYFGGKDYLDAPLSRIALGMWEGLRGGWIGVALAVMALRGPRRVALGLATLALLAVGLATAQDYSRSMTMLLPVAALGLLLAPVAPWRRILLRCCAGAALLLPAHHVMNDAVRPIFYLHHEIAAFENPPPGAHSDFYELRAIHAMEQGDFVSAESDLDLAIKLAANPASPAKQRGILRASQGRWGDALRDFSTLAKHDPKNPDAWFMRAQAQLALGQPAAARTLAPAEWITRPDVACFVAKLNAR
ncbi:MAG: tetratricopeptide repeat protein [Undibacterium sp.]|nr:tetratricopeptide repeat protein [Opitutaceae bacterium]